MASVASGTQNVGDKSTESFLTALVTNAAIGAATLGAFLILRRRFRNVYEPRYALKPTGPKQSPLPQGFLSFIPAVFRAKDEDIIRHNGLDAYLFNRFIKLLFYFFLPVAIVSWAVLLPVYGTGSNGNVQLNRFTFGNIGADQQPRLAAPLILAWASTLGFLWLIRREWLNYIQTCREFLTSRGWATRPQAKTVLITGLPKDYASESALRSLTSHLQGGVAHIWIAKDVSELADVYERQMDAAQKLEKANIKVIKQATKAARKDKAPAGGSSDGQHGKSLATKYLKPKKLPHHRLGKIPFFGKKVETIPWAEEEIETTQKELDAGRSNPDKYESRPSALILFNDQIDAHIFAQGGEEGESKTLKLCKRFINVSPDDIVWSNLGRKPLLNKGLKVVSLTITTLITIFYAPITVFVTGVSNVSSLCGTVSFLGWLCDLPSPINGIIQGALPPLALALVFLLVPIVFRLLIKLEGIPLQSQIEHRLERRYFVFLFLQGFLLATISSGIVKSISTITQDPSATVNILAQNLPAAATFFITLILVHGLTKAGLGILQAPKFLLYFAKVKLLGSTPRSLLNAQQSIPQVQFGTEYPNSLLIAVIGLSYSTISPIVCGFSAFAFFTWWFVYKYLALYVWDQPPETETAGLFFKTALNQLFAGIYIYLLCLTGLFFLSRNESNSLSTAGLACGVCSAILLGLSILVQIYLNWRLGSASVYLDASMADQTRQNERRYAQEMAAEKASPNGGMRPVDTRATDGTAVGAGGDDQKAGKGRKDAYVERDVESGDGHGHGHQRDSTGPAEADGELAGGLDETTFMHPALYREQPTVWLPRDQLGLSREAVERARARGVQITDEDATIDNDGKIDIQTDELPGEDHDANL